MKDIWIRFHKQNAELFYFFKYKKNYLNGPTAEVINYHNFPINQLNEKYAPIEYSRKLKDYEVIKYKLLGIL